MTDTLILGGAPVPPLAKSAVLHTDGGWQLIRDALGEQYSLARRKDGRWITCGVCLKLPDRCGWWAHTIRGVAYEGDDLDQALAALWAAREAL